MSSSDFTPCPVCRLSMSHKGIKRHLVTSHQWRYSPASPDYPEPPEEGNDYGR